jgi:hypothetical protein
VIRRSEKFVALSATECFNRWKEGYLAQTAGAVKVREDARKLGDLDPDLYF